MSLAHMPKWYRVGYSVLWIAGALLAIALTGTQPLTAPLTPIPQAFTAVLALSVVYTTYRWIREGGGE